MSGAVRVGNLDPVLFATHGPGGFDERPRPHDRSKGLRPPLEDARACFAQPRSSSGSTTPILNVALPSCSEQFDASDSTLQWIVDSYLLVFAGLLLTMGTLGDRFGRKRALQAGLAIFGAASLAVLVADRPTS